MQEEKQSTSPWSPIAVCTSKAMLRHVGLPHHLWTPKFGGLFASTRAMMFAKDVTGNFIKLPSNALQTSNPHAPPGCAAGYNAFPDMYVPASRLVQSFSFGAVSLVSCCCCRVPNLHGMPSYSNIPCYNNDVGSAPSGSMPSQYQGQSRLQATHPIQGFANGRGERIV